MGHRQETLLGEDTWAEALCREILQIFVERGFQAEEAVSAKGERLE